MGVGVISSDVIRGEVVTPLPAGAIARPWAGTATSTTADHSVVHTSAMAEASPVVIVEISAASVAVTGGPTSAYDPGELT